MKTVIVLPVLNEAENIEDFIEKVSENIDGNDVKMLVVDRKPLHLAAKVMITKIASRTHDFRVRKKLFPASELTGNIFCIVIEDDVNLLILGLGSHVIVEGIIIEYLFIKLAEYPCCVVGICQCSVESPILLHSKALSGMLKRPPHFSILELNAI